MCLGWLVIRMVSCTGVGGGRCEESCASGCHVQGVSCTGGVMYRGGWGEV